MSLGVGNSCHTRPVNERKEQKRRANCHQNPGIGSAASVTSEARQISRKVCKGRPSFPVRVPAMMKIISGRLATRETKTHFMSLIHLCQFSFRQDSHLVAGFMAKTKKHFVSK
jgi:hypothetical protein